MLGTSRKKVFLCDSEKFNRRSLYTLTEINKIDVAVFDNVFNGLQCNCHML